MRLGKARWCKTVGLEQPRASEEMNSRRETLAWKLGHRRKRLPGGPNRKTGLSTL